MLKGWMPTIRSSAVLRQAKEFGFSDKQLATLWKKSEDDIRAIRKKLELLPAYYLVDTCAAEFEAYTPYYYSTYESGSEIEPEQGRKVVILGGGPNRIGQGIEFDYCCCHCSFALRERGCAPSWSTPIRRPYPRTTTPRTGSISSL